MSLGRSLRTFAITIARGLSTTSINTLAKLNAIVADATLDDSGDPRTPTAHTHVEADITDLQAYLLASSIDTLAELNAIVGDATLDDSGDSRTPTSHTHPASDITTGTFAAGAYSFLGSTITALDSLVVDNLSLNLNTITTTSGDLILDATGGILAKTNIMLDGLGATDKDLIFDRADTTTAQGFRWRLGGAERWSLIQDIGSEDLVLNNSNSTGDFLVTPLGSTIHQGKINGTVVSIDRGSDGHTADLQQWETFAEVVVASMSIAGKQTVKSLEVEDGPIIWANSTGQPWHILVSAALPDGFALQGQDSATNSFLNIFSKDGDRTDFVGIRLIPFGSPASITNQEHLSMAWEPTRTQFEINTFAAGTGTARALAAFTNADLNQWLWGTDGTIDMQGVQVFDASGNHVGPALLTTLTTSGVTTIGNGSSTVAINSSDWDVSTTGVMTGFSFDANGSGNTITNIDVADLANGTDGELITWDSSGVAAVVAVGTAGQFLGSNGAGAAPTMQALPGALDNNFVFAYDGTTQAISVANTFQGLNFATNGQLNGWTHATGTSIFGCTQTGKYEAIVRIKYEKSTGGTAAFGMRALFNSVEVGGSEDSKDIVTNNAKEGISKSFEFDGVSGQNLEIEVAGSTTNLSVLPGPNPGSATTAISASITITRIS